MIEVSRINVVNLATLPDPEIPPPCRVVMAFVDASGEVLPNRDGQPVRREVMLEAGHATFLQINGDNLVERDQLRLNFRPVVRVFTPPPDPDLPPPCVPTLEIIDNTTGKTSILFAGTLHLAQPPDPERQ